MAHIEEEKIRQLYEEMNQLRLQNRSYKSFKMLTEQMLSSINDLIAVEPDEEKKRMLQTAFSAVASTNAKDVENIKYFEDLMKIKNSPKVRRQEYFASVTRAVNQVYMDLFCII